MGLVGYSSRETGKKRDTKDARPLREQRMAVMVRQYDSILDEDESEDKSQESVEAKAAEPEVKPQEPVETITVKLEAKPQESAEAKAAESETKPQESVETIVAEPETMTATMIMTTMMTMMTTNDLTLTSARRR